MKRPLLATLLLAMTAHGRAAQPDAIDVPRMIETLCAIEAGEWGKPGGAANISYAAFSDRAPGIAYQLSGNREYALPVYSSHVRWIMQTLASHRVPVTAATVGLVWRWGFDGAKRRRFRGEYGVRCQNLYEALGG